MIFWPVWGWIAFAVGMRLRIGSWSNWCWHSRGRPSISFLRSGTPAAHISAWRIPSLRSALSLSPFGRWGGIWLSPKCRRFVSWPRRTCPVRPAWYCCSWFRRRVSGNKARQLQDWTTASKVHFSRRITALAQSLPEACLLWSCPWPWMRPSISKAICWHLRPERLYSV